MVRDFSYTVILLLAVVLTSCSSLKVSSSIRTGTTEQATRKVFYTHRTYSNRVTDVGSDLILTLEYPLENEPELELSHIRITATLVENMGYTTSSPEITLSEISMKEDSTFSTRYVCAACPFKLRMGIIQWSPTD